MKKTILLIHGLRGDHHGLAALAKELEQKGYNVINPDLPGSGDRAELNDKTLDGYAEWFHKNYGNKNYYIATFLFRQFSVPNPAREQAIYYMHLVLARSIFCRRNRAMPSCAANRSRFVFRIF